MKLKTLFTTISNIKRELHLILLVVPVTLSALCFILIGFIYQITFVTGSILTLVIIISLTRFIWVNYKNNDLKEVNIDISDVYIPFLDIHKKEAIDLFYLLAEDENIEFSQVDMVIEKINSLNNLEAINEVIIQMRLYKFSLLINKDEK